MAPFRWTARLVTAALAVSLFAQNAAAITSAEVMNKMSKDERFGYVTGLVDMLAYQTALAGHGKDAVCIVSAFYRKDRQQNWQRLYDAFARFGDRRPEAIVTLIAKNACGI